MKYTFYHYTSGEDVVVEAECDDQAWDMLQDKEEVGLDELKELWYIGHTDDNDTPELFLDDDEAMECCG